EACAATFRNRRPVQASITNVSRQVGVRASRDASLHPARQADAKRVDARNDGAGKRNYYLCTRQYAGVKNSPDAKREKLGRLAANRKAFDKVVKDGSLRFARPAGDKQVANEIEV